MLKFNFLYFDKNDDVYHTTEMRNTKIGGRSKLQWLWRSCVYRDNHIAVIHPLRNADVTSAQVEDIQNVWLIRHNELPAILNNSTARLLIS